MSNKKHTKIEMIRKLPFNIDIIDKNKFIEKMYEIQCEMEHKDQMIKDILEKLHLFGSCLLVYDITHVNSINVKKCLEFNAI